MSLKFVFEREEASQIAKADTEASNLAELDFLPDNRNLYPHI